MTFCCDDLLVFFQKVLEAVFSPGASLFNDLVIISALMKFFIIKVGAIQCFQDAASWAEELICARHRPQPHLAALFANDAVPIPVSGRKVGLIIKLSHGTGKLLFDFVKPFRQAARSHLFVKELKGGRRMNWYSNSSSFSSFWYSPSTSLARTWASLLAKAIRSSGFGAAAAIVYVACVVCSIASNIQCTS